MVIRLQSKLPPTQLTIPVCQLAASPDKHFYLTSKPYGSLRMPGLYKRHPNFRFFLDIVYTNFVGLYCTKHISSYE